MNELAFLSIILLSSVRLIGLGVSLDYYFETKKRKFKVISFGWFIFFISGLFVIAINYYDNIGIQLSFKYLEINEIQGKEQKGKKYFLKGLTRLG